MGRGACDQTSEKLFDSEVVLLHACAVYVSLTCTVFKQMVLNLQVWPGAVNWPDFRDPAGIRWWQSEMQVRLSTSSTAAKDLSLILCSVRICIYCCLLSAHPQSCRAELLWPDRI